jgi:hypothetical protein
MLSAVIALSLPVVLVRSQRLRAEDERIRWVLQQTIATNSDPVKLDPAWEHLQQRLLSRSKQNSGGDLAVLANRAGIQTDISLPSFGLISNSPELWWGFKVLWPLDQRYLYLLDFEASLDGAAWIPVGSAIFKAGASSTSVTLEDLFGKLSQVQHRVAVRTKISFLDARAIPAQASKKVFDSSGFHAMAFIRGPSQGTWPALRKPEIVRFTEIRSSATMSVSLFDRYPSDFPSQVNAFPSAKPLESYFAPNRVQIIRLTLPERKASGITFEWPGSRGEKTYCTNADAVPANRVAAIELSGRMDTDISVPLAAEAELYVDASDKILLAFPFVLGSTFSNAWWGGRLVATTASLDSARFCTARFYFGRTRVGAPQSDLVERLDDQTATGHLILKPSRSVALRTQSFYRYYGQRLSIPVNIEITTVSARWIDFKDCPKR